MKRLHSIDFIRGLVIVIMAIDHSRDLLHVTAQTGDPMDLSSTTPWLFLTRWITHFCAPTFVFLAGTSAYLSYSRNNDPAANRRFLLTRGLWLVLLELTVISFGIWNDIFFRTALLQVIFAIGMGFILLSFLIRLPARLLGIMGLLIILLHNALPQPDFQQQGLKFIWSVLFGRGFFPLGETHAIMVGYAIVPWLGILLLGFGLGPLFQQEPAQRRKNLLLCGTTALLVFVILRAFNLYGNPGSWSAQPSLLYSVFSFISVNKYPPSLLYTGMTLSVMFFLLALAEGRHNFLTSFFATFGRVPMFFYILHWYVIHASMYVIIGLQGVTWQEMSYGIMSFGRPQSGYGLELPGLYLYWICLIAALYPLCKSYGRYKFSHPEKKWLSYL